MPENLTPKNDGTTDSLSTAPEATPSRRQLGLGAGKFLAYTAPALLALMTAKDSSAAS